MKLRLLCCAALLTLLLMAGQALATADFSARTSLSCVYCHEDPQGGGTLSREGDAFRAAGFELPQDGRPLFWPRLLRFLLGFLHYLAAVIWLGAIFYVHLFMGPRSLTSGLPKGEVRLGRVSILVVAATGLALTFMRLTSLDEIWTTTFGLVWLVKVSLFLLMVLIAAVATTRIDRLLREPAPDRKDLLPDGADGGPTHIIHAGRVYDVSASKLWKNGVHMGRHRAGGDLTEAMSGAPHGPEVLEKVKEVGPAPGSFLPDGADGGPAHIIHAGRVYDVSASKLWKNGVHMGRHRAGGDLTEAMSGAPHGPDVLERVGDMGPVQAETDEHERPAMKIFVFMANSALIFGVLILFCVAYWRWGPPLAFSGPRWTVRASVACLECHRELTPGLHADWVGSLHAKARVSCLHCHQAEESDPDVSVEHYNQYERTDQQYGTREYRVPVSAVVTPKDCARCHPDQAAQYAASKHANTIEIMWKIDPWLQMGLNSGTERNAGCYHCHGTVVRISEGAPELGSWPNTGVGRANPDGSLGSCTSCHTRHRFSAAEARKAEACGQCHLGPDHPQMEIYKESKHGAIYDSAGHGWSWEAPDGEWLAGRDFRAPTCAVCHMSAAGTGAGAMLSTHNVTERLSWELQAPLTVRPADFAAFPSRTDWADERGKMKDVCLQCHGQVWVDDHYAKLDLVVKEYNEVYYRPARKMLDDLYARGLLDKTRFFDERLEVEFYELWHHEGRRARMGAAMMAPDYSWWHGFYECKKRYNNFMEEAMHLIESNTKAYKADDFPNATGSTAKPSEVFGPGK